MTTTRCTGVAPLVVESQSIGAVQVVRFRCSQILSDVNAREMGEGLEAALDAVASPIRFVIDLAGVQILSSAGFAKLIMFRRRVTARGGELVLCRPHPQVARAFQLTNLWNFFSILPDLDTALTSFD